MSPKTVEHYRRFLEYYIYPSLGESLDITEEDVKKLLEKKRAEEFSEGTVYAIPKLIWRILSFASAEGLCKAPEWDFVMGRPEKMNPTVILTPEQERRLLDYLTENPTPKNLGIYLILTAGISMGKVLLIRLIRPCPKPSQTRPIHWRYDRLFVNLLIQTRYV